MPAIWLRHPYKGYKGYKQLLPNGRMYICVYRNNKDRTLISLARYRLSVKLGRRLKPNEEADHIDENFTNDSFSNLQILTPYKNKAKYIKLNPAIPNQFICENCKTTFVFRKDGKHHRFCSRRCIGLFGFNKTK